jgi:gamma-glutamylcyclotransferase (GGCT)/AIG2-like uncharacterized protein YtfP
MSVEDNEDTNDVGTLLDQLKENNQLVKSARKNDFKLDKADLEQFILNNTGRLIEDSMETIATIKQYVVSAPEPDDVHSLAELYKASTSAIEALNKILIQQQKSNTQVAIKTMDIQSKQQLSNEEQQKITFTRDEIFEKLINSGDIIEAEVSVDDTVD